MPMSESFTQRLLPRLEELAGSYGTPFHLYDARGISQTYQAMTAAFAEQPFRQYFAVKALPNPAILALLVGAGSGLDCASPVELRLADAVGAGGDGIVFTSNNTSLAEYQAALDLGALITFDDRSLFDRVPTLPEVVSFRVSPHGLAAGSSLMGDTTQSKFGVPADQLVAAYREAKRRGATRFGIHGMTCANELDLDRAVQAAADVLALGAEVEAAAGIQLEYVNIAGGLGIPYRPEDMPLSFAAYAAAVLRVRNRYFSRSQPRILTEIGRYLTGPHGVLISRVVSSSHKAREVVGLDASMSALMRPAFYGAYHHLTLPFVTGRPLSTVDVVGSLCENMDKFAINRELPEPREGDIVVLHDTGAHSHAMGFTYNGRLRPAELLLTETDEIVEIRRAETFEDYVAGVRWEPPSVLPAAEFAPVSALSSPSASGGMV